MIGGRDDRPDVPVVPIGGTCHNPTKARRSALDPNHSTARLALEKMAAEADAYVI
jgi:hypothetical protein